MESKIQFYAIAHGSLTELQNQIFVARDVRYLNDEDFKKLNEQLVNAHKLLNAFIKSTRQYFKF